MHSHDERIADGDPGAVAMQRFGLVPNLHS
jgi:hypothetical protein